MDKAEAIARLKPLERRLRARGINALYVFGSAARGDAGKASDLELLIARAEKSVQGRSYEDFSS